MNTESGNHTQVLKDGANPIGIGSSLAATPSHTTGHTGPYPAVQSSPSATPGQVGWSKQATINPLPAGLYSSRTLPAFQPPLQYAGKNMLFNSRDHLPVPFGPGTVQAFTGVSPP